MASIKQDPKSKTFRIRFRFGGRRFYRSLKTGDAKLAAAILGRVEETLRLIEQGRLEVPPNADPAKFIISDGRIASSPSKETFVSLKCVLNRYQQRLSDGVKEATTIGTENTHIKHFLRLMPIARAANTLSTPDVQSYVDKRLKEKRGTRAISPETVRREIKTFCCVWNWAKGEYVEGQAPTRGLTFPKRDQKPPFMTWEEIETRISRGGLTTEEEADLWACLYLTTEQISDLLFYVKASAQEPFIHPMIAFVAFTGVRRSEMIRSRIDDFDFHTQSVLVREKKRSHDRAITFRRIDLASSLAKIMKAWFANHPGGQFSFCTTGSKPLKCDQARDHFKRTLRNSKWETVRGFHVLRHSFASNLASRAVDQRIIDLWMGHQTEEMRQRYRHLHPNTRRNAIELLAAI